MLLSGALGMNSSKSPIPTSEELKAALSTSKNPSGNLPRVDANAKSKFSCIWSERDLQRFGEIVHFVKDVASESGLSLREHRKLKTRLRTDRQFTLVFGSLTITTG
jgi:hypothetical protein